MAQQRISFEWIIEEHQHEGWQGGDEAGDAWSFGLSAGERLVVNRLVRALSLFLVIICAAAGAAMTPGERERAVAQNGIQFALNHENRAWRTRDRALFESLFDPTIDDAWHDEWREQWRSGSDGRSEYHAELIYVRAVEEIGGGFMLATVVAEQPAFEWWQTSPYRETRFYRREGQNWLRTVPPISYWGERRTFETEHLRFSYYARDTQAVVAAAQELERAYVEMYRLLGLEGPPAEQKLTVAVLPRPVGRWSASPDTLEVTSPQLSQIPQGQSDAEYLAYDVMNWFTYRALRDAAPGSASRYLYRWPILVWGLRGWLRDDLLTQTSPWRIEALRVFNDYGQQELPFGLVNVSELRGEGRPSREQVIMRYLAAESFIRFVVDTYGRERLPDLLAALVRYGSWNDLIPEVYGHSVEKFVADWNVHLMKNYGPEALGELEAMQQ